MKRNHDLKIGLTLEEISILKMRSKATKQTLAGYCRSLLFGVKMVMEEE